MQKIVIDTNVIISANLSGQGNPAKILQLALDKEFQVFYTSEIMAEYVRVLARPRFNINLEKQQKIIEGLRRVGTLVAPLKSDMPLIDESDRIFYDTAKESRAILITGNIKHYPSENFVMTPTKFLNSL